MKLHMKRQLFYFAFLLTGILLGGVCGHFFGHQLWGNRLIGVMAGTAISALLASLLDPYRHTS